jgi:hypothetical protein
LYGHYTPSSGASSKKKRWIGLGVIAGIIVAVVLPVYFLVVKKHKHQGAAGAAAAATGPVTGGDGSTVVTDGGATFVYRNPFGGYCGSSLLLSPLYAQLVNISRRAV